MNSLEGVMVVGLTGQTGAGKSTVSKIFSENEFYIIDADKVARYISGKGSHCLIEIGDCFGKEIVINEDCTLNRSALAKIVFNDSDKLKLLNSIMYPYIISEILNQIRKISDMGHKFILLDAPTLFESHADDFCKFIVSVVAKEEIRKERIMKRDNISAELAQARMNSQLPESFFLQFSDFIIENNSDSENLKKVSNKVIDKIKNYYNDKY